MNFDGQRPKQVRDRKTGEWKLAKRKAPPNKDTVFRRLEHSVPREEWLAALDASDNPQVNAIARCMVDPSMSKFSLPTIARRCGVQYTQLLKLITQHRLDQGLLAMSAHVPQVLEDVAVDAKSQMVPCPACEGKGQRVVATVTTTIDKKKVEEEHLSACYACEGTGKLRKAGDSDARKLMFDTLKLTGQKAPLVAQQFNLGSVSPEA